VQQHPAAQRKGALYQGRGTCDFGKCAGREVATCVGEIVELIPPEEEKFHALQTTDPMWQLVCANSQSPQARLSESPNARSDLESCCGLHDITWVRTLDHDDHLPQKARVRRLVRADNRARCTRRAR